MTKRRDSALWGFGAGLFAVGAVLMILEKIFEPNYLEVLPSSKYPNILIWLRLVLSLAGPGLMIIDELARRRKRKGGNNNVS